MTKAAVTNTAASVHARLLNRAKAEGRPFNELLQYYVMERFLYRLSQSEYANRFVLKGALMLQLWGGSLSRSTKDIDLLGLSSATVEELVQAIQQCLATDVGDDGLNFDRSSVQGEQIRLDAHYEGIRIHAHASLGNARIKLQIDVGFGDVVTPEVREVVYPALLDSETPRLLGYTPETSIAEKLHAAVILDIANTRLKDFLDIWILIQEQDFSGSVLSEAIKATFQRRRTPLPESTPAAFTPTFYSAPRKQAQWRAYLRKARVQGEVPSLDEVAQQIEAFVMPVVRAIVAGEAFTKRWRPGGPWGDRSLGPTTGV